METDCAVCEIGGSENTSSYFRVPLLRPRLVLHFTANHHEYYVYIAHFRLELLKDTKRKDTMMLLYLYLSLDQPVQTLEAWTSPV